MKPFDLEKAKAGAKVCTRDGRDVRIVCWDMKNSYPIIGLIMDKHGRETFIVYDECGKTPSFDCEDTPCDADLMMAGVKREGWINLYKGINGLPYSGGAGGVFEGKEEALAFVKGNNRDRYIDTIKIEWEE